MFDMKKFVKERDEALISLDKKKIMKFMKKYGVSFRPSNERVFWAAIHKAICNINYATEEQKARSAAWLLRNGFKTEIT